MNLMRKLSIRTLAISGCIAAGVFAGSVGATIVKSLGLDELSRTADVVVHGHVEHQESMWGPQRSRIYTVTKVRVSETLKGDATKDRVLTVRQLGGTVDGISQIIAGNAKLADGEEVIVFLRRDPEEPLHYVVGMAQGKYTVDRSSPQPRVVRNLRGLALAETKDGRLLTPIEPKAAPERPAPSLSAFKAQVRSALSPVP